MTDVIRSFLTQDEQAGHGKLWDRVLQTFREFGSEFPFHYSYYTSGFWTFLSPEGKLSVFEEILQYWKTKQTLNKGIIVFS